MKFVHDEENVSGVKELAHGVSASLLVAAILLVIVGCKPNEAPVSGEIELKLEEITDANTTFLFSNGLNRSINVRGERGLSREIQMWPPDATIACKTGSSLLQEDPASTSDPVAREIAISPGERITVSVRSSFPHRFKGGRCVLFVMLADDTKLQPFEFSP